MCFPRSSLFIERRQYGQETLEVKRKMKFSLTLIKFTHSVPLDRVELCIDVSEIIESSKLIRESCR